MAMRNGEHGYGSVTKTLHWATVSAITGQFVVGYSMDEDIEARFEYLTIDGLPCTATTDSDAAEAREENCEEHVETLEEQAEAEADRAEEQVFSDAFDAVIHLDFLQGGVTLPELHVALGLTIIGLGLVRVIWRRTTPLPPWAEALSETERRVESLLEKALLALLFVVPGTGLLLVLDDDDWLPLHIAAHVCFYAVVALHIGLVLKHTVIRRDRHLARML